MRSLVFLLVGLVLGLCAALVIALALRPAPRHDQPSGPTVIEKMREVARLETLDIQVYKKIDFRPDPPASSDSVWKDVLSWASYNIHDPHGRAILFAKVHLGLDLQKLDPAHVLVQGDRVFVVLPPLETSVEMDPGATEIIDSNLDSAQTAQLLDEAKQAFQRDAEHDPKLQERARSSAERALRGLVLGLGFRDLQLVSSLPVTPAT